MKLHFFLFTTIVLAFSCSSNDQEFEDTTSITINFSHFWDEDEITEDDYGTIKFINESFNELSINNISYVISDMYLENSSGTVISLKDFLYINPRETQNITYSTTNLLIEDTYTLFFRFGLADEDNVSNTIAVLDDENFNLDENYGGGYYFMQLDGTFINSDEIIADYEYYMIRATRIIEPDTSTISDSSTVTDTNTVTDTDTIADTTTTETATSTTVDTSFLVDVGDFTLEGKSAIVNVKVDLSQWFTDTNDWDLNEFNTMLLDNFEAQIDMEQNGDSVFSIIIEEEE